mmetsp:Transcript_20150/g.39573  ORF Transcript_20150/g.39573 Transcript_20150/m.39573 type:complete len:589 (+) Transcript_20150:576-2342(+)|eukprot:CAMPEP_0171493142 /NCGR_PEP_ID=MMETSP0958-20121227/4803_1 /TAXON_ID=87120 /ORGANISM="Aurantiochytrium limacinum, Strain ATCCMYA-1381" /LENGTH=588 /DNA_ID=CAMNT_0012026743 /DNA_START=540 /DNA_END=2306 /DNA_ORIENTATION=+
MSQDARSGMGAEEQRQAYEVERARVNELFTSTAMGDLKRLQEISSDGMDRSQMLGYKDANGRNLLHFAASQGHIHVCEWLLEGLASDKAQADAVDAEDSQGDSCLRLSIRLGKVDAARFLFAKSSLSSPDTPSESKMESKTELKRKPSLLHEAASSGNVEMVRVALDEFGQRDCINQRASAGPPLFWAAFDANVEMVKVLLNAGADPNVRDDEGHSALLVAATRDAADVVRVLLESGADITVANQQQGETTVVHAAAAAGAEETLRAIATTNPEGFEEALNKEADGFKPLELAAYCGHESTANLIASLAKGESTDDVSELCKEMKQRREQEAADAAQDLEDGLKACENARNEGNEKFKAGDLEGAIEAYTAGVEMAMVLMTKFNARQMRLGGADATCEAQLTTIKEEALATLLCNRSACILKLGDAESARDDAQQAAELRPTWPKSHFRLGQALAVLGENADAAQAFWTGYELAPKEPGAAALLALFKQCVAKAKKQHNNETDSTTETEAEPAAAAAPAAPVNYQHNLPVEIPTDSSPDAPLRELSLRFNNGEDPFRVAARFVQEYNLDGSLVHRIAHHVHEYMNQSA